jgi:hypothetical protein
MKSLFLAVVAVLGMSAGLAFADQGMDEDKYHDTFSHNIEHIYNPSTR